MKGFEGYIIPENAEKSESNIKKFIAKIILFLLSAGIYKFMGNYGIIVEIKAFVSVFIFSLAVMLADGRYNNISILNMIKDKYIYDKKQHRYRYTLK